MDALLNVVEVIAWIVGVPAVLLLLAWGLSSRPFRGRSHGSTVLGDALGVSSRFSSRRAPTSSRS